jgi:hypothetical protein
MDQNVDLIIFAVYGVCVTWVLYNSVDTLDKQTAVTFDQSALDRDLAEVTLGDTPLNKIIAIKFKFEDRYKFAEQPKTLSLTMDNKSNSVSVQVDWDRSTLTDFDNRSRRVIRMPPNKRVDLFQPQAQSVIAPGGSLRETITAEDVLKPQDDGVLEANSPIIDLGKLQKMAESRKTPAKVKNLVYNFMEERVPLRFSLRLALQLFDWRGETQVAQQRFITCHFTVKKLPWTYQLPFNPKK